MHDTEPVAANSFAAQTKRVTTRLMPLALLGHHILGLRRSIMTTSRHTPASGP
jgi:hypothetical protein